MSEKEKLHAVELLRFGMMYWDDPLAQEYLNMCAREKAAKYFWLGFIAGTSLTIFVLSLILTLSQ